MQAHDSKTQIVNHKQNQMQAHDSKTQIVNHKQNQMQAHDSKTQLVNIDMRKYPTKIATWINNTSLTITFDKQNSNTSY